MNPPKPRPFDFAPVARALAHRFEQIDIVGRDGKPRTVDAGDDHRAAPLLGVSRNLIQRWRHGQRLTEHDADRCAIALGLHPVDLWPAYFEICAELDRVAEQRTLDAEQHRADDRRRRNAARYQPAAT